MGNQVLVVSVVIPVYNGSSFIRESIDSILSQSYENFELLLIDDCSTDDSVKIIQSYQDNRIRLICNEKNQGIAANHNKGLDLARGTYVARLDQDDISLPERLFEQVNFMNEHPDISICGSWMESFGDKHEMLRYPIHHDELKCRLLFSNPLGAPSVIVRKQDLLEKDIRYRSPFGTEDYDVWVQAVQKGLRIANIPKVLVKYRIHAGQETNVQRGKKLAEAGRIQLRQLQYLDIMPNKQEFAIHYSLGIGRRIPTQEFVQGVKNWLLKLSNSKRVQEYYQPALFKQMIEWYWRTTRQNLDQPSSITPMKIAHINLFDYQGGSARIAWMIMESMNQKGHDVRIFAHRTSQQDRRVIPIPFPKVGWQENLLAKGRESGLFDLYSGALFGVINHPFFQQADVVHIHCINGDYFSYLLLPFLATKPVVWTLHDPLAFTAGCLYPDACLRWRDAGCTECPLGGPNAKIKRQTELVQKIKSDVYQLADFTVVCPSRWLLERTQQSILGKKDIRLIANGIDTNIFQPGDRAALKEKLGLPKDKKVVMFAAHGGFNNRLKGGHLLLKALKILGKEENDIALLSIGGHKHPTLQGLQIVHIDIPYINDQQRLAEYYAAADIFVSPSMAENLSLVICEAMSCGTPVVAFDVGGNREIIDHLNNGYVARSFDTEDFAAGIAFLLKDEPLRIQAGQEARQKISKTFDVMRMVGEYSKLYNELIHQRK